MCNFDLYFTLVHRLSAFTTDKWLLQTTTALCFSLIYQTVVGCHFSQ